MTKLDNLKRQIESLSPREMRRLAAWLGELRARLCDEQLERDVLAGKFDALAEEAMADIAAGRTMPLLRPS